ncbi:hypothetical protein OHB26_39520 (plasmid) [Nocardia sp. NBC_01503]|uniref:hypothetical protein n=1 Tax=Nocardia sp. NBC_01503 TaxID=2975997 RepID=UPI002E7BA465|nr:hypothetical protein [Nocardia sp. NBC_01503]WTL36678.1 hypothetical protein OHB26_39055 [Nocardia sp. NBC_01503]WTL36769.1 hypothetical protein OHB26_39520 [Nocardia sp. NBC_01503]
MVNVGDRVLLMVGGVSIFEVLDSDGETATVQSVDDAPGRYPFPSRVSALVPASADSSSTD